MTHLVYWYPNIASSEALFSLLSRYSKFIEVQFPFSDPIADGEVISEANSIALENAISTSEVFAFIEKHRQSTWAQVLTMSYFHTVFRYGIEQFVSDSARAWVYGIIVPDIPLDQEEGKLLYRYCQLYGIYFIVLVSPHTSDTRLKMLSEYGQGFIYALSQNMTTGASGNFWFDFQTSIPRIRWYFSLPIGVGFWVQSISDIEKVNSVADFAILGTKIIRLFQEWWVDAVEWFLQGIP